MGPTVLTATRLRSEIHVVRTNCGIVRYSTERYTAHLVKAAPAYIEKSSFHADEWHSRARSLLIATISESSKLIAVITNQSNSRILIDP